MQIYIARNLYFDLCELDDEWRENFLNELNFCIAHFELKGEFQGKILKIHNQKITLPEEKCCKILNFIDDVNTATDFESNFSEFSTSFDDEVLVEIKTRW